MDIGVADSLSTPSKDYLTHRIYSEGFRSIYGNEGGKWRMQLDMAVGERYQAEAEGSSAKS